MRPRPNRKRRPEPARKPVVLVILLLIAAAAGLLYYLYFSDRSPTPPAPPPRPATTTAPSSPPPAEPPPPVVTYAPEGREAPEATARMERRKRAFGIDESMDLIVKPDESIRVGEITVPMAEILERIRLREGEVIEGDLGDVPPPAELPEPVADAARAAGAQYAETADRLTAPPTEDLAPSPPPVPALADLPAQGQIREDLDRYRRTDSAVEELEALRNLDPAQLDAALAERIADLKAQSARRTDPDAPPIDPEAESRLKALAGELTDPETRRALEADPALGERETLAGLERLLDDYADYEALNERMAEIRAEIRNADLEGKRRALEAIAELKPDAEALEDRITAGLAAHVPDLAEAGDLEGAMERVAEEVEALRAAADHPEAAARRERYLSAARAYTALRGQLAGERERAWIEERIAALEAIRAAGSEAPEALARRLGDLRVRRSDLADRLARQTGAAGGVEAYGIHVVQPGDNIWDIHFRFLREYFEDRGVTLSPVDDEPTAPGRSSGVGRILKFSENMVYIYNIRERQLGTDLDLIHPLSKIVVFNLGRALALLDRIDYRRIDRVRFDGETLWVPAGG